ncbi:MAG: Crp/Fnr family transcriptional regulator [Thermanaerothrix sp.]|nr:Crp/Fnr family transcriptional regulator [Thermanaerothrix sp.]
MDGSIYSDLFDQLSQERMRRFFLEEVAPLGVLREYRRGSSVDHEFAASSMGVVVKGCVSKSMVSSGGKEKLLYFLRPGEIFGEMDLLDGGSFPYVLCARRNSSVAYVPLREVQSLLELRPEAYRFFIHSMTRKFRIVALQLANSAFNDAGGKVAEALLRLCSCLEPSEVSRMAVSVTQQELASNIGCSRVTVARVLKRLEREGVVERRGRELVVSDVEALMRLRDGVR